MRPTRRAGFARGFSIQTVSPLPIGWAEHVIAEGHCGRALREYMRDYNHWTHDRRAQRAAAAGREPSDPRRGEGRATGMPIAQFTHSRCENDRAQHGVLTRSHQDDPRSRRRPGHPDDPALRPPDRRRPDGHQPGEQRRRRRPSRLGRRRTCSLPMAASARPRDRPTRRSTIMALSSRLAERLAGKRVTGRNGLRPDLLARRRRSTPPSSRNGPPEFAQRASQEPT